MQRLDARRQSVATGGRIQTLQSDETRGWIGPAEPLDTATQR